MATNLQHFRKRIKSIQSTKKMTSAMKMIAASRLKTAEKSLKKGKAYHHYAGEILTKILQEAPPYSIPPLLREQENNSQELLIIITSEKGLCGGLNAQILRKVKKQFHKSHLLCIGKKGWGSLQKNPALTSTFLSPFPKTVTIEAVTAMAHTIFQTSKENPIGKISLLYNHFQSVLRQHIAHEQVFPLKKEDKSPPPEKGVSEKTFPKKGFPERGSPEKGSPQRGSPEKGSPERGSPEKGSPERGSPEKGSPERGSPEKGSPQRGIMEIEPLAEEYFHRFMGVYLRSRLFLALLHNNVCEHASRMQAMDNATRNAKEMIDNLTLAYNRIRQGVITTELVEVISGAEALSQGNH